MKKVLFIGLIFMGLCSFTSSTVLSEEINPYNYIQVKEVNLSTPVVFCARGSAGTCNTRPDNQGFSCDPGGSECGGTVIKEL